MNIVVWTKPDCPYCDLAKKELHQRGFKFQERVLGQIWDREDLLKLVPNAKTVPQIFIYGEHVGGYDDLLTYFEETISNYGD